MSVVLCKSSATHVTMPVSACKSSHVFVVFACNNNHIIGFLWISKPEEDSDMDSGHVVYVGPNLTARVCRLSIGLLALQYQHVSGIRRRVRDNSYIKYQHSRLPKLHDRRMHVCASIGFMAAAGRGSMYAS